MKTIFLTIIILILSIDISNAQWVQMSVGLESRDVTCLASASNTIYAGTYNYGVYLSTNNGISWTQTPLNNRYIFSIAADGDYVFAGTFGQGIYLSTNKGANWTQTTFSSQAIGSLAISGTTIFAGTGNSGVYQSTDNGAIWTQTSLIGRSVYALATNGHNVFAGGYNASPYGAYVSADNGLTWDQTSLNNQNVYSLAANGDNIFAGTQIPGSGVFLSLDNGKTWNQTSLNNRSVVSIVISGNNVFAATGANGVYVSNDNGINWIPRNEGLVVSSDLTILNNYLFSGTDGAHGSVWRRPIGELTGIQSISNVIPDKFSLSQNYPNPFNPTTTIKFSLPKTSLASLVVYDAMGKEVEVLVNEHLNSGTYEAVWTADKIASGIYYYKLTTEEFSRTNKMILLK